MLERTVSGWRGAVPLVVRLILGVTFCMYGYQKVFQYGLSGVTNFFTKEGFPLPGVFAVIASYAELCGGIALVVGFQVRWLGLFFCLQMLIALFTVHLSKGFFYGPPDKYGMSNVLHLAGFAFVLLVLGAGPWSLDRLLRKNR
jgi:putative oxidoreductase